MKARRVKGLDPEGSLVANARRIIRVRIDELYSFDPAVLDPSEVKALHDMRIAAKRLRYVLEVTEPCFGKAARRGVKEARGLQEVLGDIHDCDVMLPRVRRHVKRLRAQDAAHVLGATDAEAGDLDPAAASSAPNRAKYRGLEALATYVSARRGVLYRRFVAEWARLDRQGFREALEAALDEAVAASRSEPAPTRRSRAARRAAAAR